MFIATTSNMQAKSRESGGKKKNQLLSLSKDTLQMVLPWAESHQSLDIEPVTKGEQSY